jgi:hypothetical protein
MDPPSSPIDVASNKRDLTAPFEAGPRTTTSSRFGYLDLSRASLRPINFAVLFVLIVDRRRLIPPAPAAPSPSSGLAAPAALRSIHRWAAQARKDKRFKLHPIRVTAEIIICQELLGLSAADAVQAFLRAKSCEELRALKPKNSN